MRSVADIIAQDKREAEAWAIYESIKLANGHPENGITEAEFLEILRLKKKALIEIVESEVVYEWSDEYVSLDTRRNTWANGKVEYSIFLTIECGGSTIFSFNSEVDAGEFTKLLIKGRRG